VIAIVIVIEKEMIREYNDKREGKDEALFIKKKGGSKSSEFGVVADPCRTWRHLIQVISTFTRPVSPSYNTIQYGQRHV
jgi:hypothetical protein